MIESIKVAYEITYFKPSGKYYSNGVLLLYQPLDMDKAKDHIKHFKKHGPLPGLTGGWDGPIVINHKEGYPVLVLSEEC